MDDQITQLLAYAQKEARLELSVNIFDGDGYAPLGADIEQFQKILFLAGVAELIYCYVAHVGGNTTGLPYPKRSLEEFKVGLSRLSVRDHGDYEAIFEGQFRQREGGFWAIGSSAILRVELVEVHKENPTVGKIIATGVAGAMLILASCTGAVWIMQQRDADRCRSEQIELARESTEMIARQARLEGRMTQQDIDALNHINETLRAGIAASGAHVDGARISLDPKTGKVTFGVGGSPLKKEGT